MDFNNVDPRIWTTPIGAAAGLFVAKKVLPERLRSGRANVIGAVGGGTLGYALGDAMRHDPNRFKGKGMAGYNQYLSAVDLEDEPTPHELQVLGLASPPPPEPDRVKNPVKYHKFEANRENMNKLRAYRAREQGYGSMARDATAKGDTDTAARYGGLAARNRERAEATMRNMRNKSHYNPISTVTGLWEYAFGQ